MSKGKKKGGEINLADLPPWKSLNVSINFNTCKRSANKIVKQITKLAENEEYITVVTRKDVINSAKDNMLYVDMENLTEKQKKEKGLEELPTVLTAEILAKGCKFLIEEADVTHRQDRDSGLHGKKADKKKEEKAKAKGKKGKKGEEEESEPEEIVKEVPQTDKKCDMFYFFTDYPSTQEDYLSLNSEGIAINATFVIKEEFFIEDEEIDLSILDDDDDNFEKQLEIRLQAFVEATRPKDPLVLEEEKRLAEEERQRKLEAKRIKEEAEKLASDQKKGGKRDKGKGRGGKKEVEVEEEEKEEIEDLEPVIETFEYTEEDEEYIKANKQIVENLKSARAQTGINDPLRNASQIHLLIRINQKKTLESYQDFAVQVIQEMCSFSIDRMNFDVWVKQRTIIELLSKEHAIKLEEQEKQRLIAEEQKRKDEEEAEKKRQKEAEAGQKAGKQAKGKKAKKQAPKKEKKKTQEELDAEEQAKLLAEQKKKEEEEEKKREEEEEEARKKEIQKNNLPYYNKQMVNLGEENITPGVILEALVDQVCVKKEEDKQKEQEDLSVKQDEITSLFSEIQNKMANPVFNQIEYKPIKIDKTKGDNTHFKLMINENDGIGKCGLDNSFFNLDPLIQRDHKTFDKILIPGINRFEMPEEAPITKNERNAEDTYRHSFIACTIPEFKRRLLLKKFIDMMQVKEHRIKWDFGDRVYMERHNRNTLQQVIYKALLFDPHVIQKYDKDSDQLLLCVYFKNPPGRILRQQWKSDWKVIPNLEFWINKFKFNEKNLNNKLFFNIDYQRIGDIHDRTKMLFPNDQSIILCQKYLTGIKVKRSFKILKEKLIFGIREPDSNADLEPEGIIHDKTYAEVWAAFDNDTVLLIEMQKNYVIREKQESDLQKEQEEDEAEEVQEEVIEEKKEKNVKKTPRDRGKQREEQPKDESDDEEQKEEKEKDELKDEYDVHLQASLTLSMKNGHIIKFLPNGDVLQKIVCSSIKDTQRPMEGLDQRTKQHLELDRIVTGKGSVIKHMKDGSIEILYANGNTSINKRNGLWVSTNNKGLRWSKSTLDGAKTTWDPCPYAPLVDPESGSKVIVRSDNVIIVIFADESRYTKHADGTEIWTNKERTEFIIEHETYATVKVRYDPYKIRNGAIIGLGGAFAQVGYSNLFERSWDGRIVETYLHDGTKVYGYKEKRELEGYNKFKENYIHLIYGYDGSVFKIQEDGELVIVSEKDKYELSLEENNQSNDASELNVQELSQMQYFLQLYCAPEDRKKGVYSGNLTQSKIWTVDDEGNKFTLNPREDSEAYIAVSLDIGRKEGVRPQTPTFEGREYINKENLFLPQPQIWMHPRLFVINNDNSGYEFLNQEQLRYYFNSKEADLSCTQSFDHFVQGFKNCESMTFITKHKKMQQKRVKLINVKLPRIINKVAETLINRSVPRKSIYLYRNLLRFEQYTDNYKKEMEQTLDQFNTYKREEKEEAAKYDIQPRTTDDQEQEWGIQERIFQARKKKVMGNRLARQQRRRQQG